MDGQLAFLFATAVSGRIRGLAGEPLKSGEKVDRTSEITGQRGESANIFVL
jgi:hypothetical protein